MFFRPVLLENIFSDEDKQKLQELLNGGDAKRDWVDDRGSRGLKKFTELEEYFSAKLEPLAKEIFKDETLKTSYSVYIDYNKPTSNLVMHKDRNACTYTIDYCVSAKTPWGVVVEGEEFMFGPDQAIAFMGGEDMHGRNDMPDPDNNRVEVIMFHFVPEDHWYFTKGPSYIKVLIAEDRIEKY